MAVPVHMNFAISGVERVLCELRAALQRRRQELQLARQGARESLRNEPKGPVAALLLSREMALGAPDRQEAAGTRLRSALKLAQEIRAKLDIGN
jgi:hypothetical protein